MSSHSGGRLLQLNERQLFKIHDGVRRTVRSCAGTVWITQQADPRDIILEAGDAFTLDRPGLTLVSALTDAVIDVGVNPDLAMRSRDRGAPCTPGSRRAKDSPDLGLDAGRAATLVTPHRRLLARQHPAGQLFQFVSEAARSGFLDAPGRPEPRDH